MSTGGVGGDAEGLVKQAKASLGQRRYDGADEAASRAIGLDPRNASAYLVRAEARRKLGRPDQALADLAVSIRLDPDRASAYVVRAEILKKRCLFDQAIADATHALLLAPENAAAFAIRAECRRAIGDLDGAAEDAQELARIDPTRPVGPQATGTHQPRAADSAPDDLSRKGAGTARPDLRGDLFADGKTADWSMKSNVIDDPDEAAEALARASGYKPGVIIRSSPRARSSRGRPSRQAPWVMIILGGAMLLGLIGGGSVLVNHDRGAQDARSKGTAGQAAVASTAVKTEDRQGATSNPPALPGDGLTAASRVVQATGRANPETVSAPPPVVGSSVRLQEVAEIGGSDRKVWWLDLDEAGTRAVTAEDRHLKLWDFRSGFQNLRPTVLCSNDSSVGGIMAAALLPGSENVVTGHYNGEVRVWDARRRPPSVGRVIKKFPDLVPWVAVSPDGKLVATGVRKLGQVDLWRNEKGELTHLAVIAAKEECWGANFSPDSKVLAVGYQGESVLWDCTDAKPRSLRTIRHDGELAKDLSFSPDGGTLAIPLGTAIKLYDLKRESEPPVVLEDSSSKPSRKVLFSRSGKALFSCGYDQSSGVLSVWDIGRRRATQILEKVNGADECLSLSRDGAILVSGGRGGVIRVWRVLDDEPIADPAPTNDRSARMRPTSPSPTATGAGGRAVSEVVNVAEINTKSRDYCAGLSPDGLTIYWATDRPGGGEAEVWTATRRDAGSLFEGRRLVAHGRHVAVSNDGLTMLLVAHRADGRPGDSIQAATRRSMDEAFGRPQAVPELVSFDSPRNLCLSGDGLTLLIVNGAGDGEEAQVWEASRSSPQSPWGRPKNLAVSAGPGVRGHVICPFLTVDGLTLLGVVTRDGDPRPAFMSWTRRAVDQPWSGPRPLLVPGVEEFFGWQPVYVGATHELFFCSNRLAPDGGDVDLWVVRDFVMPSPSTVPNPPGEPTVGEIRRYEGHTGPVMGLAFSPDGKLLASAGDTTVRIWRVAADPAGGSQIVLVTGEAQPKGFIAVAFSPDGGTLAASRFDGSLVLWDVKADPPVLTRTLRRHADPVIALAFSPDGRTLATAGRNEGLVCFWDTTQPADEPRTTIPAEKNGVWSLAFSPDGKTMAEGVSLSAPGKAVNSDRPGEVWIWDVGRRPFLKRSVIKEARKVPRSLTFSPDGSRLAFGDGDVARVIDALTGRLLGTFEGHSSYVVSVAFTPDGKRAICGGYDKTLRLWDASTMREIRRLDGHTGYVEQVGVSPDGSRAASCGHDKTVRLWGLPLVDAALSGRR